MKRIRVLLAALPPLVSSLLTYLIQDQSDMEVVDAIGEPVQLLMAVKDTRANVVVLPLPESGEMPGICSHLLAEFPDLLILALSINGESGFICTAGRVQEAPLNNILKTIRLAGRKALLFPE
jgi:DNA-binding NarL/FixJ family response regulator